MRRNTWFRWMGCVLGVLVAACAWAADPPAAEPAAPPPGLLPLFGLAGGTNQPGQPGPFSADMNSDFIKKIMETSARIEEAKRAIAKRQAELYADHPEIKACREKMMALQKQINVLLDADAELNDLKLQRDMLWTTMPVLPRAREAVPRPMPAVQPEE